MTTQAGENVHVFAVKGNFDDAQTGVKEIFANQNMAESIEKIRIPIFFCKLHKLGTLSTTNSLLF